MSFFLCEIVAVTLAAEIAIAAAVAIVVVVVAAVVGGGGVVDCQLLMEKQNISLIENQPLTSFSLEILVIVLRPVCTCTFT